MPPAQRLRTLPEQTEEIPRRYAAVYFELADLVRKATGCLGADQAWINAPTHIEGKHEDEEEPG
jgi:hypothetical protein